MSIDAFSQALGGTDLNQMMAAARTKAAALPPVAASPRPAGRTGPTITQTAAQAAATQTAAKDTGTQTAAKDTGTQTAAKDDSFLTFGDILDTINPLQHIPLVDALYRHLTGDTIRPQGQILGGLLYGGLIGGAVATASVLLHEATGIDPEEEILTALLGDSPATPNPTATAAAIPAGKTPAGAIQIATAPPIPLHPAPRTAAPAPAGAPPAQAALPAPPPGRSTADARARQLSASNTNALQQLAMDLAAGGQVGGDAAAPVQGPPGKMPARGTVSPNPAMPAGFYAAGYRGHSRGAAPSPQNGARPAGPANTRLWQPLSLGGQNETGAGAPSQTLAQAPTPAPTPALAQPRPLEQTRPQAPSALPAPQIPPPEMISQLMVRNLDKYQALSRAGAGPNNYIN